MRCKSKTFASSLMIACSCSFLFTAYAEDAIPPPQTELMMGTEDHDTPESIQLDAAKGDANTQLTLAKMYFSGNQVPKDVANAIKWYRKAAEQNNTEAMFCLSEIYRNGFDIEKDEKQGIMWLQKAANQGHVLAQCDLGIAYRDGSSALAKNEIKSFEWLEKAACGGSDLAKFALMVSVNAWQQLPINEKTVDPADFKTQYVLGKKYWKGAQCPVDKKKAILWYTKSAQQGCYQAMNELAWLYATSPEKEIRNGTKALEYARKAMKKGRMLPETIDTFAAAYAANGQFDEAITAENRAIALFNVQDRDGEAKAAERRLIIYQHKRPYLE